MTSNVLKRFERYLIRQYNIGLHIFDKIFFFKYNTRQIKTTETNTKVTYFNWKQRV